MQTFKDYDVDREEYDNYQVRDGVMTPFTVTRYKNGDMVGQRFIVDIRYNTDAGSRAVQSGCAAGG